MHDGSRRPRGQVVAVEADVHLTQGHSGLGELGHEGLQTGREHRAAPVYADQREAGAPVALHDLVRDPHERAAHIVSVEDDLRVRLVQLRAPSWPLGTGLKEPPRESLPARCDAHEATGSSERTSRGSPRSGNGISIESKSRGTTVCSNTARASSRISRPA